MEMSSSQARFDSHKYLVITNLFFNAPSDLGVTREDLLSILEQLENIERFRFQEESEHSHWTKAYIKFKARHHASQALSILQSMKYVKIDSLPKILNRFIRLENKIRYTNSNYDNDSCIMVELNSKFSHQDLFNKFNSYGKILNMSDHNSCIIFSYRKIDEAFVAEMDNNKWSNNLNYLTVKLFERTKELTIRTMDSMSNCNYSGNNSRSFENECQEDLTVANNSKQVTTGRQNDVVENVEAKANDNESNSQNEHESASDQQNTTFNSNDYSFYLQIIRKNPIGTNFSDGELMFNSGISIALTENELHGCPKTSEDDLSLQFQESLNDKFQNLNLEESEYGCYENVNFQNSEENFATDLCDSQYFSNFTDFNQKMDNSANSEIKNDGNVNPLPFYRCGMDLNYNYSACFYPYFDPVNQLHSSCTCPCYKWSTLSPWSIVPNVFIVPTTSFGRRRNFKMTNRDTQEEKSCSSGANVPDFDEMNFPPLGTDESPKLVQTQVVLPDKSNLENEKLNQVKVIIKKNHRKRSKQGKTNARNAYLEIENSTKTRIRRKRFPQKSNSFKQNILLTKEIPEIKFKCNNVSCQILSNTTSDEKYEQGKPKHKKKFKKHKENSIPIFSCSSNSTLNFRSSHKSRKFKSDTRT